MPVGDCVVDAPETAMLGGLVVRFFRLHRPAETGESVGIFHGRARFSMAVRGRFVGVSPRGRAECVAGGELLGR
jgi:hypothetical protein